MRTTESRNHFPGCRLAVAVLHAVCMCVRVRDAVHFGTFCMLYVVPRARLYNERVCVQSRISAVNTTLLEFAAERRRLLSIYISCQRGVADTNRKTAAAIDGTDRRTDGHPTVTDRYGGNATSAGWQLTLCDPTWHVSSRNGQASCELL